MTASFISQTTVTLKNASSTVAENVINNTGSKFPMTISSSPSPTSTLSNGITKSFDIDISSSKNLRTTSVIGSSSQRGKSGFNVPVMSSTSHGEGTVTDNPIENSKSITLTIVLTTTAFTLLFLIIALTLLVFFIIKSHSRGTINQKNSFELKDKNGIDLRNTENYDHADDTNALEVANPTYTRQRNAPTPCVVGTGVYSEVTIDSEVKGGAVTTTVATDGQVITGAYNIVTPLTPPPVRSESEIIESAAYACIQVNSDQTYATPSELDHRSQDQKQKDQPQPQDSVQETDMTYAALSDATVGDPAERPRLYTGIKVREVPAVPTKSSDLLEDLDVEAEFNTGIYSESINHLDFTRNRMEGGGNKPQFISPIYTAAVVPESYQDPAEVTSENISEKMKLGTGQFGEVVLANTKDLSLKTMRLSKTDDKGNVSVAAAVKKLQSNASQTKREAFDKEAEFMSHIKHPNVLRLLGVCHHDPAFIMMEFTEEGDLNQFLQSYSEIVTTSSNQTQMTSSELVYIASQIASGMQYLTSLKFVHRDLATRNCFIGTNNSIKVGDVGVNTSLYQSSYYRIRGNRMMPIRWMATECFSGKFSEKSDVWAFGVTIWELFTLAKDLPYPHLSDEEVIHNALKREYRQFPVKPVVCPQPVYEVMERCWAVDMRHRPTFQKIIRMLQL